MPFSNFSLKIWEIFRFSTKFSLWTDCGQASVTEMPFSPAPCWSWRWCWMGASAGPTGNSFSARPEAPGRPWRPSGPAPFIWSICSLVKQKMAWEWHRKPWESIPKMGRLSFVFPKVKAIWPIYHFALWLCVATGSCEPVAYLVLGIACLLWSTVAAERAINRWKYELKLLTWQACHSCGGIVSLRV